MASEPDGRKAGRLGSSNEDLSEYTDADESISAPTEFLAEFLSAIMLKDYTTALKYCKLILQYEPNNNTAKEFYPLIVEKIQNRTAESSSSSSGDEEPEPKSSHSDSEDSEDAQSSDSDKEDDPASLEQSYEGNIPVGLDNLSVGLDNLSIGLDNSSAGLDSRSVHVGSEKGQRTDSDGTTNSYSSLEDEEAIRDDNILEEVIVEDNYLEGDDNGNTVSYREKIISTEDDCNFNWFTKIKTITEKNSNDPGRTSTMFQTSSDSESPTDPVTQHTIEMLRAKFVQASN